MFRVRYISTNFSNILLGVLSICIVLFSCEVEEVVPITHSDELTTEPTVKNIDEFVNCKTISLNTEVYAQEVLYTEKKIIISALKQSNSNNLEFLPTYLLLDNNLDLISENESTEEIEGELDSFINIGDSVLAFRSGVNNSLLFYQFKTTDNIESKELGNNAYFNYSNGFIYKRELREGFCLDYYSESFEKLWTKSFESENAPNSSYIFNLNNSLFYISFDSNTDKVYVEKFKNPSVVLKKASFALNKSANKHEELFAISNSAANYIVFALYDLDDDKTRIYSINDDCFFEILNIIDGRFEGIPQFCTINGSVIVSNKNSIIKFNANWEVVAEREFNNSISGICGIGDNLNLLYQNLPSGEIRLSYLDKHLNLVVF